MHIPRYKVTSPDAHLDRELYILPHRIDEQLRLLHFQLELDSSSSDGKDEPESKRIRKSIGYR